MKYNFNKNILNKLVDKFWFVPNDIMLRSIECTFWKSISFNKPVLEIGIGDGIMDQYLFQGKRITYGIDIDPIGVKNARKFKLYTNTKAMDASKMTFKNNSINTAVANSTFEHIKFDLKAVSEVSRVLKKNGMFHFCVPTENYSKFISEIGAGKKEFKKYNARVAHFHYHDLKQWQNILKKNHLKIIDYQYYFPKNEFRLWYFFHKLSTYKPYKRELWSYLKDSPYGKIVPSSLVRYLLKKILLKYYKNSLCDKGAWVFITAQKI